MIVGHLERAKYLLVTVIATDNGSVILEWNPPRDNGGADITHYQIFINSSEVLRSNVTMTTIVLDFEEDHFVQVRATNCAGESDNASLLIGKSLKLVCII